MLGNPPALGQFQDARLVQLRQGAEVEGIQTIDDRETGQAQAALLLVGGPLLDLPLQERHQETVVGQVLAGRIFGKAPIMGGHRRQMQLFAVLAQEQIGFHLTPPAP